MKIQLKISKISHHNTHKKPLKRKGKKKMQKDELFRILPGTFGKSINLKTQKAFGEMR